MSWDIENKLEREIRERWFKDHVATLEDHGDLKVLKWKKPGTICYYSRYVFDGNRVYVSGDLGEAVFTLTWKADIHSFNDVHIDYFEEKLSAYSGDKRAFDSELAKARLLEWKNELLEKEVEIDEERMEEFLADIDLCSTTSNRDYIINQYHDDLSEWENDINEWIYDIGEYIPARVISYLVGLKMASEQLRDIEASSLASSERTKLSKEEATSMLPDGESIHTFRQTGFALIGADWDRADILAAMEKHPFELSGEQATSMGHGMAFSDESGYVFVETKKVKGD